MVSSGAKSGETGGELSGCADPAKTGFGWGSNGRDILPIVATETGQSARRGIFAGDFALTGKATPPSGSMSEKTLLIILCAENCAGNCPYTAGETRLNGAKFVAHNHYFHCTLLLSFACCVGSIC
jgi:hypothetical protein